MYLFFDPIQEEDAAPIRAYFDEARSACSDHGGASYCKCSSDPAVVIRDPMDLSLTRLFFCLPYSCLCNNGTVVEIGNMVGRGHAVIAELNH